MSHRQYLFSLRLGHALRASLITEPYNLARFSQDLLAGATVGIIAIPLAMALSVSSGIAPEYGLYSAIIAGFFIALCGGSRYNVSGPTAAFVVILYPIAQNFGLSGLLVATMMSGIILILMALLRLGRYIQYIPESVVLGFTAGIAVVIVILQSRDFLGLPLTSLPSSFFDKMLVLSQNLPLIHLPSVTITVLTLLIMFLWPRLGTRVPPQLPAIIAASLATLAYANFDIPIDTIASRFSYVLPDGTTGNGVPAVLPHFEWPWLREGLESIVPLWNWQTMEALFPAALAIAMLGSIESLLSAVVLDGMSGKRHSANSELLGQGIGNIIAPFFGGMTATAGLARSTTNLKAGASSPIAAMVHSIVVLLGLVALTDLLGYMPMPAMAALLLVVAWRMSEVHKVIHLLQTAPRSDIAVFLTCFFLTVMFDMVTAIGTGMVLAALLFMKEIADMTRVSDITHSKRFVPEGAPEDWGVVKISGPLFFAAADRVFGEIASQHLGKRGMILYLDGVPLLDAGGLSALERLMQKCAEEKTFLMLADLQFQPLKTLAGAGIKPRPGEFALFSSLAEAVTAASQLQTAKVAD